LLKTRGESYNTKSRTYRLASRVEKKVEVLKVQQYPPTAIRNVILVGHSNSGKTSLSEAILFGAGAISRLGSVGEGTTSSDFEPESTRRKISTSLSVLPYEWAGCKVNLLDAPGYMDFSGEAKSGFRVVEGAVLSVCSSAGVEVGTEQNWNWAIESNMAKLVVVNKMDRENADFKRTLDSIQAKLNARCLPVQIPIGAEKSFKGVIDLVTRKAVGAGGAEIPVPTELKAEIDKYREKLVEAAVETDDAVMNRYLEGDEVTNDEVYKGIKRATALGKLTPVLVLSSLSTIGVKALMDFINLCIPSPADVPPQVATQPAGEKLGANVNAALAALVFKTSADPFVGKLSYFRVYSGTFNSNSQLWNASKSAPERVGQLYLIRGKNQEPVAQVIAGDIGAVARLTATSTGDTICLKEHLVVLQPLKLPQPMLSKAVYPKSKADLDKMSTALPKLNEEDPTITVRRDAETAEIVVTGLGETHLDVSAERMTRKFGVEVRLESPKIAYRETILTKVKADFKHKKQTGGHGQYGHVVLEVEPLPKNSGFEFAEKVVGGAVPKNFFPAVEKGVNEAKHEGVLAGYPITDVRATLVDGSSHPVDSSEIAFKIAAAQALKKGLTEGKSILLEPVANISISVPENYVGDIMSDLNTKRGRVMGMSPEGNVTVVKAQAPLAEVQRYSIDLRQITQGRGNYSLEYSHYEEVPSHITQKIVAARLAEREKEKE
jgi:elongation factor G